MSRPYYAGVLEAGFDCITRINFVFPFKLNFVTPVRLNYKRLNWHKAKPWRILEAVVKWLHCANGLFSKVKFCFTFAKSLATLNKMLASSWAARCFSVGSASTSSSLLSREYPKKSSLFSPQSFHFFELKWAERYDKVIKDLRVKKGLSFLSVLTFAFTTKLALFMPRESRQSNWSPIDSKCSKNRD